MTTMTISIESDADARKIALAVRQLKGVAKVKVHHQTFQRIPGVPNTQEELIESVAEAMDGYRRGEKGISQQELQKEIATWK